jgi:hypothetical protein
VLEKSWTPEEHEEITKVPSLLVLNVDFDSFSPRNDPWIAMHFGQRSYGGPEGLAEMGETFQAIAAAATEGDLGDLYELARSVSRDRPDAAYVFEAKPGIFGFSIDIIRAGTEVRDWLRGRGRPVHG